MRSPIVGGAIAVLLLASGCSDDDGPAAETSPTTATPLVTELEVPITALEVELVEPGGQPRQQLRHDVEPGTTWRGDLSFDLDIENLASAGIQGESTLDVVAVDDIVVDYALTGLDVTVGQEPTAEDAVEISGEIVMTDDRSVSTATLRAEAPDQYLAVATHLDPRLPFLLLPFPQEAVGEGAQWTIRGPLSLFGLPLEFEADARLVERTGDQFTVNATISMADSARPEQALLGTAEIRGDLSQVGPTSGTIALSGTLTSLDDEPTSTEFNLQIDQQ